MLSNCSINPIFQILIKIVSCNVNKTRVKCDKTEEETYVISFTPATHGKNHVGDLPRPQLKCVERLASLTAVNTVENKVNHGDEVRSVVRYY